MKDIVIYTVIFGDYDHLIKPKYYDILKLTADFICFTDDSNLKSDFYKIIKVKRRFKDATRDARFYKLNSHKILIKDYKIHIWIDANLIFLVKDLSGFIKKYLNEYDIAVLGHDLRNCLYDEAKWVIDDKVDFQSVVLNQLGRYKKKGFPNNFGLAATNFVIRRQNDNVKKFNDLWYSELLKGSKRDQLSFDYVRWYLGTEVKTIEGLWNDNEYVKRVDHKVKRLQVEKINNLKYLLKIVKKKSPKFILHIYRLLRYNDYRGQCSRIDEFNRIKIIERKTTGHTNIFGNRFQFIDSASFCFIYDELFNKHIYNFGMSTESPYIIDAGANIGLSIVYFKQLYQDSEIIAFEPDPNVFNILSYNIEQFRFTKTTLINKALWNENKLMSFWSEGSDGGRISFDSNTRNLINIETVRLREFLYKRVDFLKIDIEGAETIVLQDCIDLLINVDRIFVEYHSFSNDPQNLHVLLKILQVAGFRYYIQQNGVFSPNPFINVSNYLEMDLQLNIFGYR